MTRLVSPDRARIGAAIESLDDLVIAANRKRSVIGCIGWLHRRQPAAFVLSLQARMVYDAISAGMWVYLPIRSTKEVKTQKKSIGIVIFPDNS